jgi:hypothetical protein
MVITVWYTPVELDTIISNDAGLRQEARMPRKPKVQRTPEEKWLIVLEGLKSGNVAETCRKYEIAPTLYYRWKGLTGVVAWPGGWAASRAGGQSALSQRTGLAALNRVVLEVLPFVLVERV